MFIIGIAGGTGSGKTTLVNRITESMPESGVRVIPQDAYYRDNSHIPPDKREEINFDRPEAIEFTLLAEQLQLLRSGQSVRRPVYSYITCTRSEETVEISPADVIILEGILVLADAGLREMLDLRVFVDADPSERLKRVIDRDLRERGRSEGNVLERYSKSVKPMHDQFIEPSKRYADLIIPQGGENAVGVRLLTSLIRQHLAEG